MTDQTRQLLEQAQVYQQQMQGLITQKEALSLQLLEVSRALEELGKSKEQDVYKLSGPVMIKAKKAEAEAELKERKESIELRTKTIDKSEARIREKIEELRKKLSEASKPGVRVASS